MNILLLSPEPPYPPTSGGRLRVFNIMKELVRHHKVYLISYVEEEHEISYKEKLLEYCADVELVPFEWETAKTLTFFGKIKRKLNWLFSNKFHYASHMVNRRFEQKIYEFLDKYSIDLVQLEHSYLDRWNLSKWRKQGLKKVLIQHNLEYKLAWHYYEANKSNLGFRRRIEEYIEYLRFKKFELKTCADQDLCVMMSEDDKRELVESVPEIKDKTIVVPNGVDIEVFTPPQQPRDEKTLVFTGLMKYIANEDGIMWFYNEIFSTIASRYPEIKVYVVGREPSEQVKDLQRKDPRIIVTGFVEDVREYMYKGTVFICPLRIGSGTRLKVLEAMASGIPIVSTSLGSEGITYTDTKNIMIADTPSEFANRVITLLENPEMRNVISKKARQLVEDHYSWRGITEKYNRELEKLVRS